MGVQHPLLHHALLLSAVVVLLHGTRAKLMYINGVQQKDLTPLKPNEVNNFVSALQLFAEVVRRDVNDGPESQYSAEMPGQDQNITSNDELKVPIEYARIDYARGAPKLNSKNIELPSNLSQIRQERGVGATFDVSEYINTLLGALQQNSSKPVFMTNFASTHTDETD